MDEKLMEKMEQYSAAFGEGFPMIPLAWGRSDEEIIKLIDRCLRAKKNAYDLGLVEDSDEVFY